MHSNAVDSAAVSVDSAAVSTDLESLPPHAEINISGIATDHRTKRPPLVLNLFIHLPLVSVNFRIFSLTVSQPKQDHSFK